MMTTLSCHLLLGSMLLLQPSEQVTTYGVLIKGDLAGWELVRERTDAQGTRAFESEHEVFISDGMGVVKRLAFETSLTLAKGALQPLLYTCRYLSGETKDSYEVHSEGGRLKRFLTRAGHTSEAGVPIHAGMILVDFNVYHHYEFLLAKYDSKRGGRQSFKVFIPLVGGELPVAMSRLEDSDLEHPQGVTRVQNYRVEFVGIWNGTLATDSKGRMVRLHIHEQDLEVLRQDLLPEGVLPSATEKFHKSDPKPHQKPL